MKRFLDVLLSLLAIIFLSPLMLIISLIIICDDGLPVIFRQNRVGKGDELFKIKKFRTMKNGAPNLSTADFEQSDEFITRSGKFLRRTSLDELPQLFNVLAGDMSFIGPRPLSLVGIVPWEFVAQIANLLIQAALFKKFLFKPVQGIIAKRRGEVNAIYGEAEAARTAAEEEKAEYDREYIERRSLLFDTKIFFRTIWVVLTGKDVVEGGMNHKEEK